MQVLYVKTSDDTFTSFYAWIFLPVCVTAMVISFLLKQSRTDLAYKIFLYSQYFLFSIVSEILTMAGSNWERVYILVGSVRSLTWLGVLPFAMRVRARGAMLSDEDLSDFLSMFIIRGGLIVSLGQMTFLPSHPCSADLRQGEKGLKCVQ